MTPNKLLFSLFSPSGQHARLSIFIFHRVLPAPDPIFPGEPDAACFEEIIGWIKSWFNVLPLDAAVDLLKCYKLPARAAAITFDDGYADNHDVALPILQRHGLPATFFIASGFLDGGRMWNDTVIESIRHCQQPTLDLDRLQLGRHSIRNSAEKKQAIENIIGQIKYMAIIERTDTTAAIAEAAGITPPCDLMMTSTQVRALHQAGMQIGAHTLSHPILARTAGHIAHHEIAGCKQQLESVLCEPVNLFAYPNGKPGTDYLPEHVRLVERLGFTTAVSTAWGTCTAGSDLFQLPRFTPWSRTKLKFALHLIGNLRNSRSKNAATIK